MTELKQLVHQEHNQSNYWIDETRREERVKEKELNIQLEMV